MSLLHERDPGRGQDQDDAELLSRFREDRNEAAFTELVRRHLPLVFHVALRRLGSAALAEEAAQHAFSRLAAKVAAVARHPERLRAWLHRTAYFEASTLARKEARLSRLPVPADSGLDSDSPSHPAPMTRPEIYDRLDEELSQLPELDRELVIRHCCGGEDYRRIAAVIGRSEASCQKRVERTLARLGRRLGGARTAGVMLAGLAATTLKSQALPAAERIAAAALKQQATAGGLAGALSGMKIASCAALALAGGAIGWQRPAESAAPPAVAGPVIPARPGSKPGAVAAAEVSLAPRPVRVERSLDEVLEAIQAGRFAPLIEFLPQASASDLQAILAEDDLGGLSEGMGGFGAARELALQRWLEIDPAGAFRYSVRREQEGGNGWMPSSPRLLAKWLRMDPGAAGAAYLALFPLTRQRLAEHMVAMDDAAADRLAAIDPKVDWVVREQRLLHPGAAEVAAEDERLMSSVLDGTREQAPGPLEAGQIVSAFWRLAETDAAEALARVERIPWPEFRLPLRASLSQRYAPASRTLAPGEARAAALASEMKGELARDPEKVIGRLQAAPPGAERDAIFEVVATDLASREPWRLLELACGLKGAMGVGGISSALEFAGRSDPQRALALLPGIAARFSHFEGTAGHARDILSGWLQKDAPAAIRWAAAADLWLGSEELGKVAGDPEALVGLLSDPDERVSRAARRAMIPQLSARLADGSIPPLLARMPREAADEIVEELAVDLCLGGRRPEALAVAALASPAGRREKVLPRMAYYSLRQDAAAALEWLQALPAADRSAIVSGMEDLLDPGDTELRQTVQQLKP